MAVAASAGIMRILAISRVQRSISAPFIRLTSGGPGSEIHVADLCGRECLERAGTEALLWRIHRTGTRVDGKRSIPFSVTTATRCDRDQRPGTRGQTHHPRRAIRRDQRTAGWMMRLPDRKSTRLNSSHLGISYAVFCLKKKKLI